MQLTVATVWNISNSKHFSLWLFGHLIYFIGFKCPIANTIWFNSVTPNWPRKMCNIFGRGSRPIQRWWTFCEGILGSLKIFLFEPSWFDLVLGFEQSPFQLSSKFRHDATTKLVQVHSKARDVTARLRDVPTGLQGLTKAEPPHRTTSSRRTLSIGAVSSSKVNKWLLFATWQPVPTGKTSKWHPSCDVSSKQAWS